MSHSTWWIDLPETVVLITIGVMIGYFARKRDEKKEYLDQDKGVKDE